MNHIEKMAEVIYDNTSWGSKDIDCDITAQAAFDALMDAVPDLVWGGLKSGPYEIEDAMTTPVTDFYLWFGDIGSGEWLDIDATSAVDEELVIRKAKAAANTHHRKQVRKIWETET